MEKPKRQQKKELTYNQNKTLGHTICILLTGEIEYKKFCKNSIFSGFYVRTDLTEEGFNSFELYDYESQKNINYNSINSHYAFGIVEFDNTKEGLEAFTFGLFKRDESKNCRVHLSSFRNLNITTYIDCISDEILPNELFFEDYTTMCFLERSQVDSEEISRRRNKSIKMTNFQGRGHDIEQNGEIMERCIMHHKKYKPKLSPLRKELAAILPIDRKWGCEVEFASGYIPDRVLYKYGYVMCRDGSTASELEAVSIPYAGEKGLDAMIESFNYYRENILVDDSCSFHLHLSGFPHTRSFVVAFWLLSLKIQGEMFLMFNHAKLDYTLKKKNPEKNYNKLLPELVTKSGNIDSYVNKYYKEIFLFLSEDQRGSREISFPVDVNDITKIVCNQRHPVGQKWYRRNRYCWLNMSNIFFSKRNTIEFRIHTPTANPVKATAWLYICNAVIEYCKSNIIELLNSNEPIIFLNTIIDSVYMDKSPWLASYLKEYIRSRKSEQMNLIKSGDFNGESEMELDSDYDFRLNNKSICD